MDESTYAGRRAQRPYGDDEMTIDLLELLKRAWKLMVLLGLTGALLAYGYSMLLPDTYTASTTIYILGGGADNESGVGTQDLSMGSMLTSDVSALITSTAVKDEAASSLGLESLSGFKLSATNSSNSRVMTLSVEGTDPSACAEVANTVVKVVDDMAVDIMGIQSVNVVDAASVPYYPSGPNRLLIAAIGAAVGAMLALGYHALNMLTDTRVHSAEQAQAIVGVPVVGQFPSISVE